MSTGIFLCQISKIQNFDKNIKKLSCQISGNIFPIFQWEYQINIIKSMGNQFNAFMKIKHQKETNIKKYIDILTNIDINILTSSINDANAFPYCKKGK